MLSLLGFGISVLTFIVAVTDVWFAWKQLFPPDRRLILHTSECPGKPQQTLVTIRSVGKHDVPEELFGGNPLTLTLTWPVQSVISTELSPFRTPMLCEAREGKLVINPGLIKVNESITVLIETNDAGTATITKHDHQMSDVELAIARSTRKIQRLTKEKRRRPQALGSQLVVGTLVATASLAAVAIGIISFLTPPPLSITPSPVVQGETATSCGSGLHPFDVVSIEWSYSSEYGDLDTRKIASGQVGSNGEFCVPFHIPETTNPGNYKMSIILKDGGDTQYHYVDMSVIKGKGPIESSRSLDLVMVKSLRLCDPETKPVRREVVL